MYQKPRYAQGHIINISKQGQSPRCWFTVYFLLSEPGLCKKYFALKLGLEIAETRGQTFLKILAQYSLFFSFSFGFARGSVRTASLRHQGCAGDSLSGAAHALSYSRPLSSEIGIWNTPCHSKRDYEWGRHFPVYLYDKDESCVHAPDRHTCHFVFLTKPGSHPHPATSSPRMGICRGGKNLCLCSVWGLLRVACTDKWRAAKRGMLLGAFLHPGVSQPAGREKRNRRN